MSELRLVMDDEMPEGDPIDNGMVCVGRLPTGEYIMDCSGHGKIGTVVSSGKLRYISCPQWVKRNIANPHKWAGE